MRCRSCPAEIAPGHRYCGGCGAPVDVAESPTRTSLHPGAGEKPPTRGPAGRSNLSGAARLTTPGSLGGERFIPGVVLSERYRIVGLIGKGGMGEVFRADDLKLGQPVALKFLPEALARDDDRLARFFGEVRTARLVTHPNVCRVFDLGEVDGQHFISMEYVDGEDLGTLLKRIGRLPKDKAIQLARQLCAGVAAAHDQGILHRDLKPANVMIDGRGRVRITDFGLAGLAEEIRQQRDTAGTPAYMAPEQLDGRGASVRSDLYALGLVLYELFTGKAAFRAGSVLEIVELQRSATPTSPSSLVEGFDPAVERIIFKCIEKDPARRPSSALTVAAALPGGDPLAAALAAGETPSPELVAAAGEAEAMHPARALALALLTIALFAGGARLAGPQFLRAYAPIDRPPAAMIVRAQEIIRDLGYTEDVYRKPADTAIGYSIWTPRIEWIEEHDKSADRWERLRQARPSIASFWYRQSPSPLIPRAQFGTFVGGRVRRWNPFPSTVGEILVSLDAEGRLELFSHTPRRYLADPQPEATPDWQALFDMAGLDMAEFEPVESRYQRYIAPARRAAWLQRDPDDPENAIRIEAGSYEGRIVLFAKLDAWEMKNVGAPPEVWSGMPISQTITLSVIVALLIGGGLLARLNLHRGRADRKAASRLAGFVFVITVIWQALGVNSLFSGTGFLIYFFPLLGTGLLYAVLLWVWYIALEPFARRIWPSMLISWSRLMSTTGHRARDPLVGRSVLAGMLAVTAAIWLMMVLEPIVVTLLEGSPVRPREGNWHVLIGQRQAISGLVGAAINGLLAALLLAFVVVGARLVARRPSIAVALTLLVWGALDGVADSSTAAILVGIGFNILGAAVMVTVLLRFGLMALLAGSILVELAPLAATPDWTAWHSQPAIFALMVVVAMAAYGYWAASAGRSFVQEGDALAIVGQDA